MKTDMHIKQNNLPVPQAFSALLPAQQHAYDQIEERLHFCSQVSLVGGPGGGRSTIARKLAARYHGCVIGMEQFASADYAYRNQQHSKGPAVLDQLLRRALAEHDFVVVDDFSTLQYSAGAPGRAGIVEALFSDARAAGKRMLLVRNFPRPNPGEMQEDAWLREKAEVRGFGKAALVLMGDFGAADYAAIVAAELGAERAAQIDFNVVFRYASKLNLHELQLACRLLAEEGAVDAKVFIACLEEYVLRGNLRIQEVEALDFKTLPGSEEIIEALETNVILPFENRELGQKLGVKPKRGVLLYGPPGTGKTSIGRALAHRMKGKFFMIDGSIITEPPTWFFAYFRRIVDLAKENSPSVLFIDDADVLFGIHHVSGLVRYLLSLLDGVESESSGNVCVMMTAMDPRKVPDALMRSGRVELWLETRAPDVEVRSRILQRWTKPGLPDNQPIAFERVGAITEGLTPADLRRIAGDARLLYAADLVAERTPVSATDYMVNAAQDIIDVRVRMAQTLGERRVSTR